MKTDRSQVVKEAIENLILKSLEGHPDGRMCTAYLQEGELVVCIQGDGGYSDPKKYKVKIEVEL